MIGRRISFFEDGKRIDGFFIGWDTTGRSLHAIIECENQSIAFVEADDITFEESFGDYWRRRHRYEH